MVIYLLQFPNGKHYVGRTSNTPEQRWREHKHRADKGHQHPLYYAINKYGWDSVIKSVLVETTTHEELVTLELDYIKQYDSLANGYNLTLNTEIGGDNWQGRRDTKEYAAFVQKMLDINSQGKMHGKSHNSSSIQKMKEKAKGRFSLPWYIERYGETEGTAKYEVRCSALRNRKMKKDSTGKFKK